jgi:hypothetical protein
VRGLTGLGPLARQGVRRTLSACLAAAIDEELIELNPCRATGCRKARGLTAKAEPDPLTREEARLLADTARDHFAGWYPLVMVGLPNRTAALRATGPRMAGHRLEGRPAPRGTSHRARTRRTAEEWGSSRRRPIASGPRSHQDASRGSGGTVAGRGAARARDDLHGGYRRAADAGSG